MSFVEIFASWDHKKTKMKVFALFKDFFPGVEKTYQG